MTSPAEETRTGFVAARTVTIDLGAPGADESPVSAVSWPAVLAGAFTAAAISLILLALGSGLGFASVSPWPDRGVSAATFGVATAIWMVVVQWVSAAFGGYITGRLRTNWVGIHDDEVFFRDTANGFLSWAVAVLATVAIVLVSSAFIAGAGAQIAGRAAQGGAQGIAQSQAGRGEGRGEAGSNGYLFDSLFRPSQPAASAATGPGANPAARRGEARGEVVRIFAYDLRNGGGDLTPADRTYVGSLVAAQTGLSQDDAEKRVDDVYAKAKTAANGARQKADQARKTAATVSIFTAFSLLIGAFIAAAAGGVGGHRRDD